ncbi:tripartite tricarboxylate transporter substrate binding protein [Paracoccus beibuensis]|uniref:tripartite tricarboxylate transporter substrate binding protein n=1 Tax=Paracoccus beibuensis TaxID=547602 RepID=UPI00223F6E58|nr:tripartite tricarboxylate transporter substrate-binding protein [Paracoccus beibuensis]
MTYLKTALLAATAIAAAAPAMAEWAPSRPIEFVVASGAGGGTDNFARTIQATLNREGIIDNSVVVLNKGGGSGAEAFLYAMQNEGDAHKLIFGTNNAYLLPHVAQMAYSMENLDPVAALALDEFLIWVKADAPYETAADFIEAAKAEPGSVTFGGSQSKDTDETLVSLIEQTTGAEFKYVPFNGGGEVGVQLAGGHVDAHVNNPNEALGQWQSGAIRPLCVFSPERMAESDPIHDGKGWHDIPTCQESGVDIASYRMPRTVWMPAGADAEAKAFYTKALRNVAESDAWQEYLNKTSQTGVFLSGEELSQFITENETSAVEVFAAEGWTSQ